MKIYLISLTARTNSLDVCTALYLSFGQKFDSKALAEDSSDILSEVNILFKSINALWSGITANVVLKAREKCKEDCMPNLQSGTWTHILFPLRGFLASAESWCGGITAVGCSSPSVTKGKAPGQHYAVTSDPVCHEIFFSAETATWPCLSYSSSHAAAIPVPGHVWPWVTNPQTVLWASSQPCHITMDLPDLSL